MRVDLGVDEFLQSSTRLFVLGREQHEAPSDSVPGGVNLAPTTCGAQRAKRRAV
jgi:hypothetical protein